MKEKILIPILYIIWVFSMYISIIFSYYFPNFFIIVFYIDFVIIPVIIFSVFKSNFNKLSVPESYLYTIIDNLIIERELKEIKYGLCFNCNKILNFYEYYLSNVKYIDSNREKVRDMIQLWNNENIELYCCQCNSIEKLKQES